MKNHQFLLVLSLGIFAVSCQKDSNPILECSPNISANTRFFEFTNDRGQTFIAWTTDTVVINQVLIQLSLSLDLRNQHMNGKILEAPEGCKFNQDWSWYFAPGDWALADASIEVCDGDPQFVEENLDEYIRIGRYCPWGSIVLQEIENPF